MTMNSTVPSIGNKFRAVAGSQSSQIQPMNFMAVAGSQIQPKYFKAVAGEVTGDSNYWPDVVERVM